eukprot:gene15949-16115_t
MNKHAQTFQVVSNLQVSDLKLSNNQVTEITVRPTQLMAKDYIFADPHNLNLDPTKTYKIRAKTIIVAAGTMGSAEILLRSNIPNSNIGKGLIMHPSIGVLGVFPQPIFNTEGLLAAVYAPSIPLSDGYFFESMSADAGFIASIHPGVKDHINENISQFSHIGGFGVMLVDTVTYGNRVFIDEEAFGAILSGWLGWKWFIEGSWGFHWGHGIMAQTAAHSHLPNWVEYAPILAGVLGITLATLFYRTFPFIPEKLGKGSVFMLLAIIKLYNEAGTTDIAAMAHLSLTPYLQKWLWLSFFVGMAVKIPMWPFHTWLPDAHVEAPTAEKLNLRVQLTI